MKTLSYSTSTINQVARKLLESHPNIQIITLSGTLGAGKTTLAQEILRMWGVTELITSPTFTYVNVYEGTNGTTLYHFDCYRIESLEQFIITGFHEYLYSPNSVCIIEWPEVIMPLISYNACHLILEYQGEKERLLKINPQK